MGTFAEEEYRSDQMKSKSINEGNMNEQFQETKDQSIDNKELLILLMTSTINKLTHTQTTHSSRIRGDNLLKTNPKEGQTVLKNPFKETLPLKFPKNHIAKGCSRTMLDQTHQNPHVSSVRNFVEHNRSRFFEGSPLPLTQSQIISRHPQYLFDSFRQRKLSNSGVFGHLSRQSLEYPIRLRTYEDIGTVQNGRKISTKNHCRPDPIITPTEDRQYNSTLERTWREARRHRDNGIECQKVIHQAVKIQKREPYGTVSAKGDKSTSYKEAYMKARGYVK